MRRTITCPDPPLQGGPVNDSVSFSLPLFIVFSYFEDKVEFKYGGMKTLFCFMSFCFMYFILAYFVEDLVMFACFVGICMDLVVMNFPCLIWLHCEDLLLLVENVIFRDE